MTDLWILCEHGEATEGWHPGPEYPRDIWCLGGHVATVREVVAWLVEKGEWPHGIAAVPVGEAEDV